MAVIGHEQIERSAVAAAKAGAWLRRIAGLGGRAGARGGRPVAAAELALTVLIGLVAARLLLTLLQPGPVIGEPPPPASRAAGAAPVGNPFRIAAAPAADEAEASAGDAIETSLDLALHGTWLEGDRASAIIRTPDGRQKTFFVGDPICCGAVLERVYADQVLISRGGAREALRLPRAEAARRKPAPAPAAPAISAATAASLADVVRVEPVMDDGGVSEVRLFAGRNAELFRSLGFRDGDILVAIDGTPLPGDAPGIAAALESLEGSGGFSVTVERNGVQFPLQAQLSGGGEARDE